ncbi:enoyl-CoA hydratase/isomerase family protein [Myriangium duriaei CBS 260.36]|uniref:Enoyl-CoA hydratase/isomerase family protein n=1 Tax=Myriangium duriaei CBS 260.36 TaxID=1168546 RepID=A0A9P4IXS5_9PEZI|nr:enoyl-CoA hydratase/isomerase family protein [Myriangium duriaei CBS 260.36]
MSDHPPRTLPSSYASLPYTQIRLSHHPSTSPTPTPVIVLTLNRPDKYNAFTEPTMAEELVDAFTLLDLDDRVRAIVVTGAGRMFCAGADLTSGFKAAATQTRDHRDGGGRVALAIHRCRKPVIGAINGSAVGIGITMTLPMAIRIAYKGAKIGFVFARRGLVMEACSSFFLPRLIGWSRATHLVTTAATYPADHKLLDQLFSETLDRAEDVLPRALEIATDVAENTSAVSQAVMRDLMWRGPLSAEQTHLLDSRIIFDLFTSKDNKEGVQSFMEKRAVKFTGTMQNDAPSAWPWWDYIDTAQRLKPKL